MLLCAQLRADKEQHAVFSVFDENMSWYLDENIRQFCDRSRVHKSDPDFHKSNVMHSECRHNYGEASIFPARRFISLLDGLNNPTWLIFQQSMGMCTRRAPS